MLGDEIRLFFKYCWHVRSFYLTLLASLLVGAVVIKIAEGISIGDSVYFAFITSLTIGYGDIAPTTMLGRTVSVLLGMIGVVFTGLVVAVAVRAVRESAEPARKHD